MPTTMTGSGIAFNDSTSQLSAGTKSFASNGWSRLPNGTVLQWGVTGSYTGATSISFPISFPSACISIHTQIIADYDINEVFTVYNVSASSFAAANSNPGSAPIYWFAIGY
jgi:hypothetical protein